MSYVEKPEVRVLDQVYERELGGKPARFFDFENASGYYALVEFGFRRGSLASRPDYILKPFTSQIVLPERPTTRVAWVLSSTLPQAEGAGGIPAVFGFVASPEIMAQSPPTHQQVGVSGALSTALKAVINDESGPAEIILGAQFITQANRTIEILTDGTVRMGPGTGAIADAIRPHPAGGGRMQFLAVPRLASALDPTDNNDLARKAYVDAAGAPVGVVVGWMSETVPNKWRRLNGAVLLRAGQYADLFAVLGTTWNTGSELATEFRLPDLRGRTLLGDDATHLMGTTGGELEHALSISELPAHAHSGHTDNIGSHSHTLTGLDWARGLDFAPGVSTWNDSEAGSKSGLQWVEEDNPGTNNSGAHDHGIPSNGSDTPHNNMPPYGTGRWIIKAEL